MQRITILSVFVVVGCVSEFDEHDFGPEVAEEVSEIMGCEDSVECFETDSAPALTLVGGPCTKDEECITGQCFTSKYISEILGQELEIPGGMCSKLLCEPDECGPGGKCIDASAIADAPIQLCLQTCEDSSTCRYSGGYGCFDTGIKDDQQKPVFACLPATLVVAIKCGDGVCDNNERADPTLCPEDCK